MKKVFGLLMGITMLASISVMADERVLRDSELDTVSAGAGHGFVNVSADGDVGVSGHYSISVTPTSGSGSVDADITPHGTSTSHVSVSAGGHS